MNSTWKRLIINIGQWVTYKELVHLDVFVIREEHYPLNSQSCSDTEKRHSRAFIRAPHLARRPLRASSKPVCALRCLRETTLGRVTQCNRLYHNRTQRSTSDLGVSELAAGFPRQREREPAWRREQRSHLSRCSRITFSIHFIRGKLILFLPLSQDTTHRTHVIF